MNLLFRLNRLTIYLVALVFVTYLALVAINRNDRPPSPTAIAFAESLANRPSVADAQNAYLFILGFGGPPESEPAALGMERRGWAVDALARGDFNRADDPLPAAYDYRSGRDAAVSALADTCAEPGMACFDALASDRAAAHEWLLSERWLLERYTTLIDYTAFHEALPFELDAPLPEYMPILESQRLLLIAAWYSGRSADADRVADVLQRDLEFWRMVLTNADSLLAKIIATAAITHHFKFGNGALRGLHASHREHPVPPSWLAEFSHEERSVRRTLIGEWAFMENAMMSIDADSEKLPNSDGDADTWDRMEWRLYSPLYQPQDFSNRYAETMVQYIELFDRPYRALPAAYDEAAVVHASTPKPFERAYNIVGDWLFSIAHPDLTEYAARVADLEGVRRAAVLASQLRARSLAPEELRKALADSELRNPYTNEPFTWIEESNEILFQGLATGDRGRHLFQL